MFFLQDDEDPETVDPKQLFCRRPGWRCGYGRPWYVVLLWSERATTYRQNPFPLTNVLVPTTAAVHLCAFVVSAVALFAEDMGRGAAIILS